MNRFVCFSTERRKFHLESHFTNYEKKENPIKNILSQEKLISFNYSPHPNSTHMSYSSMDKVLALHDNSNVFILSNFIDDSIKEVSSFSIKDVRSVKWIDRHLLGLITNKLTNFYDIQKLKPVRSIPHKSSFDSELTFLFKRNSPGSVIVGESSGLIKLYDIREKFPEVDKLKISHKFIKSIDENRDGVVSVVSGNTQLSVIDRHCMRLTNLIILPHKCKQGFWHSINMIHLPVIKKELFLSVNVSTGSIKENGQNKEIITFARPDNNYNEEFELSSSNLKNEIFFEKRTFYGSDKYQLSLQNPLEIDFDRNTNRLIVLEKRKTVSIFNINQKNS